MSVDPIAAYRAIISPQGLHVVANNDRPFKAKPASLRSGAEIPPRQWLYGSLIIRRYVTVLVAPGGVGKTAWSSGVGMSMVVGRALLGDYVHARCNVLFCSLEDPEDEFDRRVAAAMQYHGLDPVLLAGRVHVINGRDRRLVVAALDEDGMSVCYPDKEAMSAYIRANKIGIIFVDPFVNSHELEENSNPHINAATRAWAEIGDECDCAPVLIHHTRKGAVAGDIDSGRGASALIGACRVGLTLSAMSVEDASGYGIPESERQRYVRLDDAKANLAPKGDRARWFYLASVNLGNATAEYPHGDNVQALAAWEPPALFAKTTGSALERLFNLIEAGLDDGACYAPTKRGKGGRWVGFLVMEVLDVLEGQAAKMVRAWLESKLLFVGQHRDPLTRKMVDSVFVDNSKRPTVSGEVPAP